VSATADPGPSADGRGWLALRGSEGLLRGEVLLIAAGRKATVGRGSGSTLPLTRSAGYRALSADPAALRQACQGVSRIHFRVAVPAPGEATIEDLSRAGTYVDGSRIEAPLHLRDLRDRPHELRFGRQEVMELRWVDAPGGR
jgi:hypothetical protein